MSDTRSSADTHSGFSTEERAAMKERARELKTSARRGAKLTPEEQEQEVLAKIEEMTGLDRELAETVHAIVKEHAPQLTPKTYYGMPAYAKAGKVVVFFQAAGKFKTRYATLGFNDTAALDEGTMWPTSFALTGLTDADEQVVAALIARAAG